MKKIPAEIAAICFKLDGVSLRCATVARSFDIADFVNEVSNNNLGMSNMFTKCAYGSDRLIRAIDDYLDLLHAAQPMLVAPLTLEQASGETTLPEFSVGEMLKEFMRKSLPFTAEMVAPEILHLDTDLSATLQELLFPDIFRIQSENIFKKYFTNSECEGMFCRNFNLVWFVARDPKGNGPFTYVCADPNIVRILINKGFYSADSHEIWIPTPHIYNTQIFKDKNQADEFRRIVQLGLERS